VAEEKDLRLGREALDVPAHLFPGLIFRKAGGDAVLAQNREQHHQAQVVHFFGRAHPERAKPRAGTQPLDAIAEVDDNASFFTP